ncbi:endo-1,4-beta-xylanase (plasmid) [Mesorhizobium sp. AR02]|uniref:endo-1,4-beta-xylanase n=1 Tax=Mesorhizobium sp. AR02 TaxID=2865837 RepID=UPI00215EA376|nr:endo-1,4-beta-xylanase [Mesorhizobium sp. AR02]UVK57311.1 endo-1,4-beta-xylanase [Mesorhizobium sp. AR02]
MSSGVPTIQIQEATASHSLGELGKARGLEIGCAFSGHADARYRRLLAHHSRLVVPEWQLKPRFLRPRRVSPYNFGPCDAIAGFAASNGMAFHGHTLFWHEEPIRWAHGKSFERVKSDYGGFIRDVMHHYPQAVSWDVFNEIVGEQEPLRDEFLISTFGLQFIDYCLRLARENSPTARLVINDYNLECSSDWSLPKQDHMLRLLDALRAIDSPLHAIGIQGHLSSVYRASAASTVRFIDRIADLGLDVFISELDVNDSTMPADIAVRDGEVAAYYEEFLTAVLSRRSVKRLVLWGISDFDNWIVRRQTQEKRRSGKARPALFDDQLQPKPAFDAVVRALESAPPR